jgi:hypothetical protein
MSYRHLVHNPIGIRRADEVNNAFSRGYVISKQLSPLSLIWLIFTSFELNFESFCPDLKAIHGLNGRLSRYRVVV